MSQEKYIAEIQKEAGERYPIDPLTGSEITRMVKLRCNEAFIAGANSKAVENEMCRFAEWIYKKGYINYMRSEATPSWGNSVHGKRYTTEQLLTEYKKGA